MFGLWVPLTIVAAGLQTLRTAQQKRLTGVIGQNGAHFARYFYGAPLAALLLLALGLSGQDVPVPGLTFLAWGLGGGIAQIIATGCLIHAYTLRNFTVATTYSKTEIIQAALLSVVLLGEALEPAGWVAIAVGFAGLVLLTTAKQARGVSGLMQSWRQPVTFYGLASGGCFALSSIGIRSASLGLDEGSSLMRAATTLAAITAMQTVLMGAFLLLRDRRALAGALGRARTPAASVGIMSVIGSFGWFWAMTLEPVAHVRALGQIEIVFTIAMTILVFRERPTGKEYAGAALIVASVLILLLGAGAAGG